MSAARRAVPTPPALNALLIAIVVITVGVMALSLGGGRRTPQRPGDSSADGRSTGRLASPARSQLPIGVDASRARRLGEMVDWMERNRQFQRVADGEQRLRRSAETLEAYVRELDGWMAEPGFTAPSGWNQPKVVAVERDLKQVLASVRNSLVGARAR